MPADDQVRGRYSDGAIYQGVPEEYEGAHLDDFDAWLARVKRDAARGALDGLADDFDMWHQDMPTDEVARRIRHEMELLHPEEETP